MAYTQRKHRCKGADTCALWAVVVFALLHLVFGLASATDADEHQMLVNGWCIADGLRLYADFWDNHGPLFNYLCAALVGWLPQDHAVIYAARFVMWLNTLGVAWLVWRIAKENLPGAPWTPRAAVLVFLADAIVLEKATEIRADNPFNLCWMAALWLALRAARSGSAAAWFGAGLCLGVAFGFSVKVVMVGFALFLLMAALMARERRVMWLPVLATGAGFAVPVVLILAWLAAAGLLEGFLAAFVGDNLDRTRHFSLRPVTDWVKRDTLMALLVLAVMVDAVRRARRAGRSPGLDPASPVGSDALPDGGPTGGEMPTHSAAVVMIPPVAFLFFQYFFLLPTHNYQSLLPALAAVSPLVGWGVVRWTAEVSSRLSGPRAAAVARWAPAALCLALAALAFFRTAAVRVWPPFLWRQVEAANGVFRVIAPDEYLYDSIGHILFRRRPGSHPVTPNYLLRLHKSGEMDLRIVENLEEHEVRMAVMGYREAMLRRSDLDYLVARFVPLRLAPPARGVVLGAGGYGSVESGGTTVTIAFPHTYAFVSSPPSPAPVLAVDGSATSTLNLAAGTHRVRVAPGVSEVAWCALPGRADGGHEGHPRLPLPDSGRAEEAPQAGRADAAAAPRQDDRE